MTQHIGVLAGGDSSEHAVSILSGHGVYEALKRRGHSARLLEIENLDDLVPLLAGIDVVFNCLHGGSGEDGTVQLLLEVMGIPSIGSGPLACARAMDKVQAKILFRAAEIPTPDGVSVDSSSIDDGLREAIDTLPFPMVLKPAAGGSTLSVFRVDTEPGLRPAAEEILNDYACVLIEPFIAGRELTVGILEIEGETAALPVIEIRFSGNLFDYQAKYTDGQAEFLAPAPLPSSTAAMVQEVALSAHHALGCRGFSRVDVRLTDDGTPYVLEVNTLPGMTPLSDLPRAAAAQGIGYDDLVELMLTTAYRGGA